MTVPQTTTNPHEELQRLRKAVAIADVLDAWKAGPETVESMDAATWLTAAMLADQKPPSAVTKAAVVELLAQRSRARRLASS